MFHHPGHDLPAQRMYWLEREARAVRVRFPDHRPFISLTHEATQTVEHRCGDDLYRGRFIFADDRRWVETWSVRGPRKDYRSISHFLRI
ncbi:hypothetical protein GCM10007301_30280 [Azorhizobium oxalatiphilum]|uniref:DUF6314 domain-containing protein n=1 Tax=Azorhizobium oxalatiphilum TaxID=980631 RepID=A0A917C4I9_9HYPH|nr:hypothetical protein GCM10007301_30280 [Azorhizobium oxalatiphilum]